ncbi:MIP/aquaporin family protein [Hyphomicrobium sp.]|uniref:MIP/aquaporin family protein n=1 Tax=Hyphomicrobium sp. TaxID=82 RepID=UPI002FDE2E79
MAASLSQRFTAEFAGSALLLATVIGSGEMGITLSGGNVAVALLANALATGAILVVLITMLEPISGAHLNPAVTVVFLARRDVSPKEALTYVLAQVSGAVVGVLLAHAMFDLAIVQLSQKARSGGAQALSEWVATFGLVATILLTLRARREALATAVGLYIMAAYWFTASTSFANPAVTFARALSDTFAGIRFADVPLFVVSQVAGAFCALFFVHRLTGERRAEIPAPVQSPAE